MASTYYIDPSGGSDSGTGAIGDPWLTIPYACTQMAAGDTLYFRAGTITTNDNSSTRIFDNAKNGTGIGTETRFIAYPGETVTFNKTTATSGTNVLRVKTGWQYIIWDGFEFDGNNVGAGGCHIIRFEQGQVQNAGWLTWQNCEIHNSPNDSGIQVEGTESAADMAGPINILNCHIHNCGNNDGQAYAIYFGGPYDNSKIMGNLIENIAGWGGQIFNGYQIAHANNITLANNVIRQYGTGPTGGSATSVAGFTLYRGSGHSVYNNLIYAPQYFGKSTYGFNIGGGVTGCTFYHNLVYGSRTAGFYVGSGSHTARNNIIVMDDAGTDFTIISPASVTKDTNYFSQTNNGTTLWKDPDNVTMSLRDFHLNDNATTQTNIIDQGVDVGIYVDRDGNPRSPGTIDIGPYEFTASESVGLWTAALQLPTGTWNNSSLSGISLRFLMRESAWDTSVVTAFKLVFKGRTDANYTVTKVSIAEKDTTTWDVVDGTNQQVTFGDTWANGGTVPLNGELYSDSIAYALDHTKDYYVTAYFSGSAGQYRDGVPDGGVTNTAYISGDSAGTLDWSGLGLTTNSHIYNVIRIEETTAPPQPADAAPGIGHETNYTVTPGVEKALNLVLSDVNSNAVLFRAEADTDLATLYAEMQGDCIVDIYAS